MLTRILQGQITRVQPLLARLYSQTPEEKLIYEKLTKALEPKTLEVIDVSGGCGSMFAIDITSDSFKGIPMVRQHKIVNEILKDDIKRWHGLQLRTKA
ncbi:AIM1 (YAL046C) [Zygosaccharomyces parabailii]|uniref:ZYBA0S07-05600g1_1 n=1 Tax=Zygosaccharomyces bailii (strain CLIB 213 / ATCC 58445 / CBS 680 / BCRC 21525 / NBRC 1098 / NCYC 1416 / NRRL Y-2227) TaxID=1333698 RepID=A0A8J2T9B1_ZYGB2|nr:AIM1 (YAL046C) [Zygosaccharomyces parabailii]CDF90634.1 ZYBA0S07-05600g1_1 [Zygosaccharomyces bailii CLIB 213]